MRRAAGILIGLSLMIGADVRAADWATLSVDDRIATARVLGHDGPVRDGLFAWALDQTPDLRQAFQWLYGPRPPTEAPAAGDWASFTDEQRRAVALSYGYDGPVRDGLFARYLADRPALAADHRQRYLGAATNNAPPASPGGACGGDWRKLSAPRRQAVAAGFGYETTGERDEVDDGFFRRLDAQPDLRRAFQRLYGPRSSIEPPAAGDWASFTDEQRSAVALSYGYDGPVRDGLFARYLADRPALEADHRQRYLGAASNGATPFRAPWGRTAWEQLTPGAQNRIACAFGRDSEGDGPMRPALFAWTLDGVPELRRAFQRLYGPPPPTEPPAAGDWASFTDEQRRAVALSYGYDGPVRDGLFARYLADRPALAEDHRRRYAPGAPPPAPPEPTMDRWPTLNATRQAAVARVFGYDKPLENKKDGVTTLDPAFAAALDRKAELRRAFQRRFGPPLPAEPPPVGEWGRLTAPQRRAVALLYGYDGTGGEDAFRRFLADRPALNADFRQRHRGLEAPSAPPATVAAPAPPSSPPPPAITPRPAAPPPARTAAPPPAAAQARGGVFLLAGSFKLPDNAEALAVRLRRLGFKAESGDWRDSKGHVWRIVRVGPFASVEDARTAQAALQAAKTPTTLLKP